MSTHSEHSFHDQLTAGLGQIMAALPDDQRMPFALAMDAAHRQAHTIAAASTDPARDMVWPLVVTLLAYSSTQASTVEAATGLANAARAHAAVYVAENQVAAFAAELERVGE